MARLGVNIRPVAILRDSGRSTIPDPITAASLAEIGGADGIVCPLNEEFRPVSERDARMLREIVKTHLTIQIPPVDSLINLALSIGPDMITLVPGKKPGTTKGGGLDVLGHAKVLAKIIKDIRTREIVASILIDPIIQQVKAAASIEADFVELHMGRYAAAEDFNEISDILENTSSVALAASKIGLGVSAGRGLNYQNVGDIASIEKIEEINIGHSIISRAILIGMENAVRDMVALVH